MIYIKKNSFNSFVLTLNESGGEGSYVFEFINEFNDKAAPFYWVTNDQSNSRERYNLFYMEDGKDYPKTSTFGSQVNLTSGQYEYRVYPYTECDYPPTKNCITNYNKPLEIGRMLVDNISFIFDTGVNEEEEEIIPEQNNYEEDNYA